MCLISGTQRTSRLSQATLRNARTAFFNAQPGQIDVEIRTAIVGVARRHTAPPLPRQHRDRQDAADLNLVQ
jgi:hypothetical protein